MPEVEYLEDYSVTAGNCLRKETRVRNDVLAWITHGHTSMRCLLDTCQRYVTGKYTTSCMWNNGICLQCDQMQFWPPQHAAAKYGDAKITAGMFPRNVYHFKVWDINDIPDKYLPAKYEAAFCIHVVQTTYFLANKSTVNIFSIQFIIIIIFCYTSGAFSKWLELNIYLLDRYVFYGKVSWASFLACHCSVVPAFHL